MFINDYKKELEKTRAREDEILEQITPIEDIVSFISGKTVFMENSFSYKDYKKKLGRVKKSCGKFSMKRYYIDLSNTLAVVYGDDNVEYVFFCSEYDELLHVLSGGRCKVVEVVEKKNEVICEVDND